MILINENWLTLQQFEEILASSQKITLDANLINKIQLCRSYLDDVSEKNDRLIYGVNTGFGSLCNTAIDVKDLSQLQTNLILSHACGMGEEVPEFLIRRMLLLKILGLSKGASGVQIETIQRLIFFYNEGISPIVYQQGSLGASGDLAPLAHLCLPLIGEGEFRFKGEVFKGETLKDKFSLEPIQLKSKEGLALLNGTQFMSTYASYSVSSAYDLYNKFTKVAALSLDAFDGRIEPFGVKVNEIRNQLGQISTAELMRKTLAGSEMISREKQHVQDPYSFRCIPQVHGASLDAIDYCNSIIEREINAVTDNPTIFPEDDLVVSAGNFHGQPLALTMDFLAIALAELASISERRVYKSISGTRDLPAFLIKNSGLNSGFMITQYACASIVSQNKQLCTPASVDTIDSSNGQEDHVSMGANAGTKLFRVVDNCYSVLGIEMMHASQGMLLRNGVKTSPVLEELQSKYISQVGGIIEEDIWMHKRMKASKDFVTNTQF